MGHGRLQEFVKIKKFQECESDSPKSYFSCLLSTHLRKICMQGEKTTAMKKGLTHTLSFIFVKKCHQKELRWKETMEH